MIPGRYIKKDPGSLHQNKTQENPEKYIKKTPAACTKKHLGQFQKYTPPQMKWKGVLHGSEK